MAQLPLIALGRIPFIKRNKILGNLVFWIGLMTGSSSPSVITQFSACSRLPAFVRGILRLLRCDRKEETGSYYAILRLWPSNMEGRSVCPASKMTKMNDTTGLLLETIHVYLVNPWL